jgi:signal transduction histidine kinase
MMEKRYLRPDGGVVWVALCVQEAVNNAIRHGQASHVRVEVTRDATHLTLTIRDDGCGFDPDALSSGDPGSLGLLSMRERAELLGGEFRLHGVVGSGVAIEARLPLREDSIAGPA